MKISFNPLSFGANLLISNRAKIRGIARREQMLKDNFKATTPDEDYLVIMTTNKNSDEDKFELYDENKAVVAVHHAPLSKYAQSIPTETLSKRLTDIYNILKIKESFNSVISVLKEFRSSKLREIEEIRQDPNIPKDEKKSLIDSKKQMVKFINKDIEYNARSCLIECDSYEIMHGMKNELN